MGLRLLTERPEKPIAGVLSCWDRMLGFGTLPKICYAAGRTSYLYANHVRIFDCPRFAEPCRDQRKQKAERRAAENGLTVECLRQRKGRKEKRVKEVLAPRGEPPGLVCLFSVMEPCSTYKPWHNKQTGHPYLWPDDGKCLHDCFYFIDEQWGLCYVRVPTWLPCRRQIYGHGHNGLAAPLRKRHIDFAAVDNAFTRIGDGSRAQQIANGWEAKRSHARLDQFARTYCPLFRRFGVPYHWSIDQCEYATNIVFHKQAQRAASYDHLVRTALHTVKPDHSATFLGRQLNSQYEGEIGPRFNIRIEATRIKPTRGPVWLKLYDQFGLLRRIETTGNDLTFFKHYGEGKHRDGSRQTPRGLPAENDRQPAGLTRTAGSRQPPLSGVPVRPRRPAERARQA